MSEERRRFPRLPFTVEVEVQEPNGCKRLVETRDLGHGGLLLALDCDVPPVGTEISLRIAGNLGDGIEPPLVRARVVRVTDAGVAVQFLDAPHAVEDEALFE